MKKGSATIRMNYSMGSGAVVPEGYPVDHSEVKEVLWGVYFVQEDGTETWVEDYKTREEAYSTYLMIKITMMEFGVWKQSE